MTVSHVCWCISSLLILKTFLQHKKNTITVSVRWYLQIWPLGCVQTNRRIKCSFMSSEKSLMINKPLQTHWIIEICIAIWALMINNHLHISSVSYQAYVWYCWIKMRHFENVLLSVDKMTDILCGAKSQESYSKDNMSLDCFACRSFETLVSVQIVLGASYTMDFSLCECWMLVLTSECKKTLSCSLI